MWHMVCRGQFQRFSFNFELDLMWVFSNKTSKPKEAETNT